MVGFITELCNREVRLCLKCVEMTRKAKMYIKIQNYTGIDTLICGKEKEFQN